MTDWTGRKEDMSPDGRLRVWRQDDGDMIVEVLKFYDDNGSPLKDSRGNRTMERASVEFCTFNGGGHSPHTLQALRALMDAIKKDNEEEPMGRDPALPKEQ